MVSPSKPNHSKVANKSTSYNNGKLVKGSKPLINFKFYLDIENINISNKIENKIKEFGGSIEFFLAKEVTHFITDKQLINDSTKNLASVCVSSPKTPVTPQTPRTSINNIDLTAISSPTHDSKAHTSKHRSRADAMLQRARLQKQDSVQFNQNKSQSPVQIAKTFGTPIWTTEYALKFLEKVFKDIKPQTPALAASTSRKELNNNQKLEYHHHHHKKPTSNPNHVRVLKGNFIKIESLESRNYRPVYRELKNWPKINLQALPSNSPFDSEVQVPPAPQAGNKTAEQDMTRKNNRTKQQPQARNTTTKTNQKQQNNNSDSKATNQQQINGGYCEICRVEYDSLRQHIKSDIHLTFIKNDSNFITLDNLIKNTSNVDDFLKLRSKVVEQCTKKEEICNSNETTNRRATLKRNSSSNNRFIRETEIKKEKLDDDGIVQSNGELNCSDGTRRSRRESCRRINYAEPKEDEENSNDQMIIQPTPKNNAALNLRKSIRWLPPSPDERPPIAKPVMYKVDTKLLSEKESRKEPLSEKNKSDLRSGGQISPTTTTEVKSEKIKMKLTRVRQSELSLLSNEAENFMFPKRELSDSDDTDDDRQSTSDPAEISNEILSSELVDGHGSGRRSQTTTPHSHSHVNNIKVENTNSRSRRRNQLELFIKDNTDYYKFENLNSRLRFHEAPTQPETMNTETDEGFSEKPDLDDGIAVSSPPPPVHVNTEDRVGEIGASNINTIPIDHLKTKIDAKYKYSFERVPLNEPWYLAFQRQDEGKEKIFEYYGSTAYRKLPFELGPLPPLKQNCCLLNRDPTVPPATLSTASSSIPPSPLTNNTNTNDLLLDIDMDDNSNSNNSNSNKLNHNSINNSSNNNNNNNHKLNQKRMNYLAKRKMMIMESCHPRKSPREHASTLAILSSIVRDDPKIRRRRKTSKGISISSSIDNNRDDDQIMLMNENSMDSIRTVEDAVAVVPTTVEEETVETVTPQQQQQHEHHTKSNHEHHRQEHSQSPLCYDYDANTYKSSNRLCYEIDKFLKLSYSDSGIDDIPKPAAKCASNLIIQKAEKDENSFYSIVNKIHECEIDSEINVDHIYDETAKINKIQDLLMSKKMSNHKLTLSESLHLARIARRRKYNRTGWPRSKYVPKNLNSSSSSGRQNSRKQMMVQKQLLENGSVVVKKRLGRPPLSEEEKNRRLLERKLNSDMFTISSDSLDSSSQVLLNNQQQNRENLHTINIKEEEEVDSVSTRSMFVSDDEESFVDAVEDPVEFNDEDKSFFDAVSKEENEDGDEELMLTDIKEENEDDEKQEEMVIEFPEISKPTTPLPADRHSPSPPIVEEKLEETTVMVEMVNTSTITMSTPKNGVITNSSVVTSKTQTKLKTLTCYVKLDEDIAKTYGLRSSLGRGEKVSLDSSIIMSRSLTTTNANNTTPPNNKTNKSNGNRGSASPQKSNHVNTPQFSPRKLRKPRGRWYRER